MSQSPSLQDNQWTDDGTVLALDYVSVAHPDFAPAHLDFFLTLRGIKSPFTASFRMLELGAGQMLSSASYCLSAPMGQYLALDYLPQHAETGRYMAAQAGLNLCVSAQGFADFAPQPADAIALHGVWTWVGDDARMELLRIMDQSLQPGAVVYVSYNALPAWGHLRPVRDLFKRLVDLAPGNLEDRIKSALAEMLRLSQAPGWFAGNDAACELVQQLQTKDPHYLAHEYLNAHWRPFFAHEVADQLAGIGLEFATSATSRDHLDHWRFGPAAERALSDSQFPDLASEFLSPNLFRRDVFVKSPEYLDDQQREQRLDDTVFALVVPKQSVPYSASTPQGVVPIDADLAARFESPQRLGDVRAKTKMPQADLIAKILALMELGLLSPSFGAIPVERAASFNQALMGLMDRGHQLRQILSPKLGVMVPFSAQDWAKFRDQSGTWPHLGL